jgi:ribonuclease HI
VSELNFAVFADGASSKKGQGGYGGIVMIKPCQKVVEFGGESLETTNNQMELAAAIHGLAMVRKLAHQYQLPYFGQCKLVSDSQYVIFGLTKWVKGWMQHGWMTNGEQAVKNKDLWEKLIRIHDLTGAECVHVRGHIGVPGNEYADRIAGEYKAVAKTSNLDFKANLDKMITEVL